MSGLVTLMVSLVLASGPGPVRYDGHQVVRATPHNQAELDAVLGLARDVWTERTPRPGVSLDVVLGPGDLALLELSGVAYEPLIGDLQLVVDSERDRLTGSDEVPRADWFADYRPLASIDAYVADLAANNPATTTLVQVGESIEGRAIQGLEISGEGDGKPAVFINGTQHAREWISPMVNVCIAHRLIEAYESDPEIKGLLDQVSVLVIPMVNPDGYAYTWSTERFWRKNRRGGYGIDLNRNWGAGWGAEPGSSDDPESNNYRGTGPFSEPETAAVRDYVLAHPEIAAHVDFHAYSQLVLYPYSYTVEPPPMLDHLAAWAIELSEVLKSVHGVDYLPLAGPDFYFASGTAPDWTTSELQAFSFTIELRPQDVDEFESGFALPAEQIRPTCDEAFSATIQLAKWVVEGGPDPLPPDDDPEEEETDEEGETDPDPGMDLPEPDETGSDDGGSSGEPSGSPDDTSASCGCREGEPSPSWLLWMLLPAIARRRSRE